MTLPYDFRKKVRGRYETGIVFPNWREPLKRLPNTSPEKCLGHEYYLDRSESYSKAAKKCHYYCRYCGQHLVAIV